MARWVDHNKADHYAHAEVYALLAELVLPESYVGVGWDLGGLDEPGLLAGLEMASGY